MLENILVHKYVIAFVFIFILDMSIGINFYYLYRFFELEYILTVYFILVYFQFICLKKIIIQFNKNEE
jgi:hypothetical protein